MSNVGQMMQMGQDVMKYARQAVKGMGQDARFFRDSKKGKLAAIFFFFSCFVQPTFCYHYSVYGIFYHLWILFNTLNLPNVYSICLYCKY